MLIRTNGIIKGSYNLQVGLERFRRSLAMVNKSSTGVGAGGIDVVCYGDSIIEGYNSLDTTYDSAIHYLKVKLQEKYNPSGVVGGYGFFPSKKGGPSGTTWSSFGTIGDEGNPYCVVGKSRGTDGNNNAGVNGLYLRLNGASASNLRMATDGVQLMGIRGIIYGSTRWDVGVGAKPTIGAGSLTGTHNQTSASTTGAMRYGSGTASSFTDKITLTASNDNYIQWATPNVNNVNGFRYGAYEGALLYNGDFTCGIRLHDCGYFGRSLSQQYIFLTDQHGTGNTGGYVSWGQGLKTGGSCNAKLYIINFITNDAGTNATPPTTVSAFQTQYGQAVDYVLGLASQPSVLLVIPPKRTDAPALVARTTVGERWEDFRDAIFTIAFSRSNVAVLDLNAYFDASTNAPTGALADSGWYDDGVHFSDGGQKAWGEIMHRIITTY